LTSIKSGLAAVRDFDAARGEDVVRWRERMDAAASEVKIPVINCSAVSTLTAYPKCKLESVFA
jgi:hypothetical protein